MLKPPYDSDFFKVVSWLKICILSNLMMLNSIYSLYFFSFLFITISLFIDYYICSFAIGCGRFLCSFLFLFSRRRETSAMRARLAWKLPLWSTLKNHSKYENSEMAKILPFVAKILTIFWPKLTVLRVQDL